MKKIFFLENENGMSLVSVMVASVLGIILFMGITSGIQSMYAAQKNVDMASTAMNVSDQLRIRFDSPEACSTSMTGQTYTPAGSNSLSGGVTVSVNGASVTLTNGAEILPGTGWNIASVDLETSNSSAQAEIVQLNDTPTTTKTYRKYAGTIKIRFSRTDGSAQSPAPVYIPIVFLGDDTTFQIASCGQSAIGQIMCKSMGYVWRGDLSTPVCQKANECVYGGTYVDSSIPAAQGGFNNPLTGARSCIDASYTPIRSGTVTFGQKTGKYGFQSIVGEVYDCMKCLDANGNVTAPTAPSALSFSAGFNADPEEPSLDSRSTAIDGSLGGPCSMTLPPFPPYWTVSRTFPVPCLVTTTTTTIPPICDPVTQPTPHWGVKTGNCYPSCGQLGGTHSYTYACSLAGQIDVGIAYDVDYCCVNPTTTTTTMPGGCPTAGAGSISFGVMYSICFNDSAVPATPIGGSVTIDDTVGPTVGSISVTCPVTGVWPSFVSGGCSFVTTTTTTTTTLPTCAARTAISTRWGPVIGYMPACFDGGSGLPLGTSGQSQLATDMIIPYSGSATFNCVPPNWVLQPGWTCNP